MTKSSASSTHCCNRTRTCPRRGGALYSQTVMRCTTREKDKRSCDEEAALAVAKKKNKEKEVWDLRLVIT
ncbi:hypothetical protein PIB30_013691 [Stylosanthes scabra]|uniref:Uncharacterized protein n=1 Tax=Stylosanthes scabra TaxID=79078 RepID=A0ABU6W4S5_9FABA|nr:hypothetical protein [Stylosanthes scabra]